MSICAHCVVYNTIPESLRKTETISTHKKFHSRYCRHVEKDMTEETESCEIFEPHPYFYCKRFTYRLHLLQCLNRHKKKMEGCVRCKQVADILNVAKGRDLYEHFGVERKIHTHVIKKKKSKPKLIRRKA